MFDQITQEALTVIILHPLLVALVLKLCVALSIEPSPCTIFPFQWGQENLQTQLLLRSVDWWLSLNRRLFKLNICYSMCFFLLPFWMDISSQAKPPTHFCLCSFINFSMDSNWEVSIGSWDVENDARNFCIVWSDGSPGNTSVRAM